MDCASAVVLALAVGAVIVLEAREWWRGRRP